VWITPQFHLNLDGQKLVFDFVKWVLVGLVHFIHLIPFNLIKSKALFQEWGHTALKGLRASWHDVPQHLLGCWLSPNTLVSKFMTKDHIIYIVLLFMIHLCFFSPPPLSSTFGITWWIGTCWVPC